jgi:hypothetical protein
LFMFLLYSKENPIKSQWFVKLNLKIIIASIIMWLLFIQYITIDYNTIINSDWTCAHYLFTTECNIIIIFM